MTLYEDLLWRGLLKDVSNDAQAKKLLDEEKSRFYCGFDPTGASLTVGHLVQIIRSMLLQTYGHTPIILIGGATGLIGDPRQTSERKLLTLEESLINAEKIKTQISRFLDPKKTIYVNNYDWIKNIDMISFLRDYGKFFNINYMLAKDTVQRRLDIGISYTEFSYMIIQAIDFLYLYETMDCKIQFGGSDQWGNITSGLELIRKKVGDQHEALGLSSPLLLKSDGSKFGKSESGALWLDQELTTPYEIYQYFLNVSDDDVLNYLKTLTLLDRKDIESIMSQHEEQKELRIAQKALASSVCELIHGKKALDEALKVSEAIFTGSFEALNVDAFKMLEKILESIHVDPDTTVVDALVQSGLASSKREARTFISSHAVGINDQKIEDDQAKLETIKPYYDTYMVLRRGKKKVAMLILPKKD
ncbi:MAG: tyrosine--tRNA ligase [Acholeplasmataceae bacterium]